jgi:hypothetical protein
MRAIADRNWDALSSPICKRAVLGAACAGSINHSGCRLLGGVRGKNAPGYNGTRTTGLPGDSRVAPVGVDEILARRAWFLYELLTGNTLDVPDLTSGPYVDVLDPSLHIVGAERVRRQRIFANLPGNKDYCPLIRRTECLEADMGTNLAERAHAGSSQQREDHWAIVDLVGKAGHVRTVPVPDWVKCELEDWLGTAGIARGKP